MRFLIQRNLLHFVWPAIQQMSYFVTWKSNIIRPDRAALKALMLAEVQHLLLFLKIFRLCQSFWSAKQISKKLMSKDAHLCSWRAGLYLLKSYSLSLDVSSFLLEIG